MPTSRSRHAPRAIVAVATLASLLVAVVGCGSSGGEQASSQLAKAADESTASDMRATDIEAKVQEREEIARLLREQHATTAVETAGDKPTRSTENPTASGGAILSAQTRQSFERLASSLSGPVGLAVSPVGAGQTVERIGQLETAVAWSTSKVPVAMAAIDAGIANTEDLRAAITASDNQAATRLWNALGGGTSAASAADAELRAAGDGSTKIESRTLRAGFTPFGQTSWSLADQTRFTAGMACISTGKELLGLMGNVISEHQWGLGAADVPAQFKGGWGPGSNPGTGGGYLDRQMGILTIDGKPVAVAIAAQPADGSHDTGTSTLTQLARWLVAHASVDALDATGRC